MGKMKHNNSNKQKQKWLLRNSATKLNNMKLNIKWHRLWKDLEINLFLIDVLKVYLNNKMNKIINILILLIHWCTLSEKINIKCICVWVL